jgi:hypothetical protein
MHSPVNTDTIGCMYIYLFGTSKYECSHHYKAQTPVAEISHHVVSGPDQLGVATPNQDNSTPYGGRTFN